MLKKKQLFEQRDHLGGHLKNTCTHVLDVIARIEDISARGDFLEDTLQDIMSELTNLRKWIQIPKYESYEYSPLNKYDNGDWWIEKHLSGKFIVSKEDADEIVPRTDDMEYVVKNQELFEKRTAIVDKIKELLLVSKIKN